MKGSTGRVFRDRKIDEHKRLDIVRDLSELDDVRARTYLTNPIPSLESRSLCGASSSPSSPSPSSTLENLRSLDIETPSCKVVTKWYENEFFERKTFVVPDGYIKASHERQRNPETGLEYDLDEEDEVWLSEREKGSKILEEDLENMLIRLEFALHATASTAQASQEDAGSSGGRKRTCRSVAESLPQESAIAILAANGFSHLVYQDLSQVYKYWVRKRDAARKPILRCLQPPPALDESNPYDLFCGGGRGGGASSSKHNKSKHLAKHFEGVRSFWQPNPNAELQTPKALRHFKEDRPRSVQVVSGPLTGKLLGCTLRHSQEYVSYHGRLMHPSEFVRMGTGIFHNNWKAALRVKGELDGGRAEESAQSVGEWLRVRGKVLGSTVLGKIVSVYSKKLNLFKSGIIEDFDRTNGQHLVRYLDGFEEEWLHLSMEWVRWLPGSSVDFGIRVVKKIRKRTPVRSPRVSANMHSKGEGSFGIRSYLPYSRKALQFQLATVQDWFHTILQSALNFAASLQPATVVSPLKRGEFNGLAKPAGSKKKGKELLKWAPLGFAKAKGLLEAAGQNPEILPVIMGDLEGFLVSGCSQREDMILYEGKEIRPADFVQKAGGQSCWWGSWMSLIQVKMKDGDVPGPAVGDWLRARGHEVGVTVVSKGVGVYRPEIGTFQWGNVVAFDRLSGKHLIQYEDGLREWLFLSIHFIKWVSTGLDRKKRKLGANASVAKRLKFV
ncbi:hypothetical protein HOP50_09g54970 [Chloropicon primus]|uniref:Enhancer of polycomb-like protein n=1 Tax=Chloropicon primus TaxID=1764295 RepID=A0A5B8MRP9_9CHLO|nr:hypothetical protein A3770_09p54650 [Chloropicon primus]UPR02171.1 hypothetical protein HOP50_09g54970 [Chloropicon primus]|mmetsp:Transcript_4857/g.14502  ORF Transcript_4857/g.14502 Transcript_4857/m.14502 type:complete len:726 (-) Transcript_4857:454-2631(-)|eukprot:QDZ22947.1 hypothetical protein A3770_09p54650 [Chloropicon primus]